MEELELRTLSDLMRERDRLKDLLELLDAGETEKAKERIKRDIHCSDRDIIENPYIIYEQTRLKVDDLFVSVRKVDRAVFPVPSAMVPPVGLLLSGV